MVATFIEKTYKIIYLFSEIIFEDKEKILLTLKRLFCLLYIIDYFRQWSQDHQNYYTELNI